MSGSLNKAGKRYAGRSKSSIISHLLNDDADNCRRQMEQRGIKPKNHHRDNIKNIRRIQAEAKQQELDEIKKTQRANRKNPKFTKIDSKLKQTMNSQPAARTNKASTNFVAQNKSKIQSSSALNKKAKSATAKRKPAIPTREQIQAQRPGSVEMKEEPTDFVARNKRNGKEMARKPAEKAEHKFVDKADYGKVPDYMVQFRLEKEAKARAAVEAAERAKIPPGMRKMTEDERADTLRILAENKKEVMDSIKALPLVIETPSMVRYQGNLNKKMKEIEDTIRIFQKPTVFVAMEQ